MHIYPEATALHNEMTAWRHDFHRHPEIAFEEERTSKIVAEKLERFGLEVTRGLAKTGVVGALRCGSSDRAIGLRADMDALPMHEENNFAHRSTIDGKMHACGHDGHTTMLLGAAEILSRKKSFDGTVYFIFQPAEENEAGGRAMVEDGLFTRFAMESVYGLHNMPQIPVGEFHIRTGPIMASADFFWATLTGEGGHAAFPQKYPDAVLTAAEIVTLWNGIVSRQISPFSPAVVSVTQMEGGDSTNISPKYVKLAGTVRAFDEAAQDQIEHSMRALAQGVADAKGINLELLYERRYPATVNTAREVENAVRAAQAVFGQDHVKTGIEPIMAAEDFAWMLKERPGSYGLLGNGTDGACGLMCHNPSYDFNDEILPLGASYWVSLVETLIGQRGEGV